jgi:hypothetical protein
LDEAELDVSKWRARLHAVRLAAYMQLDKHDELPALARAIEVCFGQPDHWWDWPATVYAQYLERFEGMERASLFATRYINTLRRELYPAPDILLKLSTAPPGLGASTEPAAGREGM